MIKARPTDLPFISKLLQQCNLPIDDIRFDKQQFFLQKEAEKIVAVAAIEVYDTQAIFRSFAVDKDHRKQGVGKALHNEVIADAKKQGLEALYLLTTTANEYFLTQGWIEIKRESVPMSIEKSDEFANICPSSAVCMYMPLQEGPVKEAIHTFTSGFNCAQSVISAFAPALGLNKETALKMATGFNAGINKKGAICGVVTGAYMVLGLKYGRSHADDLDAREHTSTLLNKFDKKFVERNGSITCCKLLNGDVSNADELNKLQDEKAFECICPRLVKDSAEILTGLLND